MNCEAPGCVEEATVHLTVAGRPEAHYCEDHAIATGIFGRRDPDEKPRALRAFSADPPTLTGTEIRQLSLLKSVRGKEAFRQFGAILFYLSGGEIGAVFPQEAYSVIAAERMGFVLLLDFQPFVAPQSEINERAAAEKLGGN